MRFVKVLTIYVNKTDQIKVQTIQFSINIVFVYKQFNVKKIQLNVKTVLFQTIQFSISTQFCSLLVK